MPSSSAVSVRWRSISAPGPRRGDGSSGCGTMASASRPSISSAFSRSSSGCTRATSIPAPALGWLSARRSLNATAARSGSNPSSAKAPRFSFLCPSHPPETVWHGVNTPLLTPLASAKYCSVKASFLVPSVPAGNGVSIAGSPHHVWIDWIGNGEAGFATAHLAVPSRFLGIHGHTRAAHVPVILHIAVEVVWNLVVHGDVVHLADGQSNTVEPAAVDRSNDHAGVIGNYKAVWIGGIDPDVVCVSAPADFVKILARIERLVEGAVRYINFIVTAGRHSDSNVVARASNQGSLIIDGRPLFTRVIGSPDRTLVFGLNQCKDTIRICWSNGDIDLAQGRVRRSEERRVGKEGRSRV